MTNNRYEISGLRAAAAFALIVALIAAAATRPANAQSFKVLYTFQGGTKDGATPAGKLIMDSSGNLYGMTEFGGARTLGWGTVYKLDLSTGKETVLYAFTGGADGGYAYGGLVRDTSGNLYGTTTEGGDNSCGGDGCGVVFKLDTANKEKVLYQFSGGNDGGAPNGDLVRDKAGNLYGTSYWGPYGFGGVVFKVDPKGQETVLHDFSGLPDGEFPTAGLFLDAKGNLFGTTSSGGGGPCFGGCGTVFTINKSGEEAILYRFLASPDGMAPYSALTPGTPGNFYGTTNLGGNAACNEIGPGCGTAFEVNVSGKETVLYRFRKQKGEDQPDGGLILDSAGNLYGTTAGNLLFGHATSYGTVFKLDSTGKETVLYRFTGGNDGCTPLGDLMMDVAGNLYGVASGCGSTGDGVVFEITP